MQRKSSTRIRNKDINRGKFSNFLKNHGCEILASTNEYEMIRWKGRAVGVLYKSGKTSGEYARKAVTAYKNGSRWNGGPRKVRRIQSSEKLVNTLLDRDGNNCIICGKPLYNVTIEHLLPIVFGGPNTIANLALAHANCNRKVDNMTLVEKINFIVSIRAKLDEPCWIIKKIRLLNIFLNKIF